MLRLPALLLFVLAIGCASVRSTGSFIEHPAPLAMHELARDAARELATLYPPPHTEISFAHSTADAFGPPLLTELRGLGFAVSEAHTRGSQLQLTYVVDEVETLYRVILRIVSAAPSGRHRRLTLTRAYSHRDRLVRSAGGWTQLEAP